MSDNKEDFVVTVAEKKELKDLPLPGNTSNKPVYLVIVLSDLKEGRRAFVSSKLTRGGEILKLTGHEIKTSDIKKTNNVKDAQQLAIRGQILDIEFPWQRILSIRNLSYKTRG